MFKGGEGGPEIDVITGPPQPVILMHIRVYVTQVYESMYSIEQNIRLLCYFTIQGTMRDFVQNLQFIFRGFSFFIFHVNIFIFMSHGTCIKDYVCNKDMQGIKRGKTWPTQTQK